MIAMSSNTETALETKWLLNSELEYVAQIFRLFGALHTPSVFYRRLQLELTHWEESHKLVKLQSDEADCGN